MRKCIIVDDDRWALVDIKASFPFAEFGFELAAECLNAEDALEAIHRHQPDLVITDVCMEAASGIDLLRICRKNRIQTQFVVVSGYDQFSYVQEALNNGALYYLLKPISADDARRALERVQQALDTSQGEPPGETDSFQRVLAYMQMHYAEQFSLEDVAQRFGFHKNYLSELFPKQVGMGFARYKTLLRIEAAQKLMRSGMNASEAAAHSGFSDVHYFSRVFKRMTGKSPSEWRNQSVRNHSSKEN